MTKFYLQLPVRSFLTLNCQTPPPTPPPPTLPLWPFFYFSLYFQSPLSPPNFCRCSFFSDQPPPLYSPLIGHALHSHLSQVSIVGSHLSNLHSWSYLSSQIRFYLKTRNSQILNSISFFLCI